jgi:poly-gamma-glutamate capsule biosynthesis protein CapA/YwtB (metallophosphatase superfamily)
MCAKQAATHSPARRRFWVLLRWKEDGATLIFGHAPHFAHELEEHDDKNVLYKPHGAKH